jgi:hypothetical protein
MQKECEMHQGNDAERRYGTEHHRGAGIDTITHTIALRFCRHLADNHQNGDYLERLITAAQE